MLERAVAGRYGGSTPHRAENAHGPEETDGAGNTDVKAIRSKGRNVRKIQPRGQMSGREPATNVVAPPRS
jgi:hypothetical protein